MADHTFSPDGKFMWTGSEWIPAPPSSTETTSSANVSLQDSVISGDINITQNNIEDIKKGLEQVLAELGFAKDSSPNELTVEQTSQVEQILEVSEEFAGQGIEIDPWTEITLGNAARLAGRTHSSQQHFLRALNLFRENGDRRGDAAALRGLGGHAYLRRDFDEMERLYRESLAISKEIGDRRGEAASLTGIGTIEFEKPYTNSYAKAEPFFLESLVISKEIGDRESVASDLCNLAEIKRMMDDIGEAERMCRESLAISKEIGDRYLEAAAFSTLGNLAYNPITGRGDIAEAERLYRESLSIEREFGYLTSEAHSLRLLGTLAKKRGDLNEEMRLTKEALTISREIGDRNLECTCLYALDENAVARGDLEVALRFRKEALAISQEIAIPLEL